ncbi:MAG TPA: YdjY domain-containing protein, partial [Pirellulales bacterium]
MDSIIIELGDAVMWKSSKSKIAFWRLMLSTVWIAGAIIGGSTMLLAADTETPKNPNDPGAKLKLLEPDSDVWIDMKNKQVVLTGSVCLTHGPLEMFAVPKGTKEHEAVVAVKTKAAVVHAGLLAVGAENGKTVRYQPKYEPATGDKVEVLVFWTDEKGEHKKARAQDWIRDVKTKKAMTYPWVFAGSQFYVDEETKKTYYMAEAGDFICVSNFPDA